MSSVLSRVALVAGVLLIAELTATPTQANVFDGDINSGQAKVDIDLNSDAGASSWILEDGGPSHMNRQWFWYRVDGMTSNESIDTISTPSIINVGPNTVTAEYSHDGITTPIGAEFTVSVKFTLTGGTGAPSDMEEEIVITNNGNSTLNIQFFQFADFNLNGVAGDDTATIDIATIPVGPGIPSFDAAIQTDSGPIGVSETIVGSQEEPIRFEVNDAATLYGSLTGGAYDLANVLADGDQSFGPGDAAWALQWDLSIGAGASITIAKDKRLDIPEPASMALMGLGATMILMRRRKA